MHRMKNSPPEPEAMSLEEQHKLFVADGIDDEDDGVDGRKDRSDITDKFFWRFLLRKHVNANNVWIVYRDGKFYKQLPPGPHFLFNWNIIWSRWQVKRINLRTVLLPIQVKGRVKGPPLPHDSALAANADFACNVTAQFQLTSRLVDIQKYLSFEHPLSVFYSAFHDMVVEMIGRLPYDQYGEWATTLRDYVRERLQGGGDNAVNLVGLKVEEVYVTEVKANEDHDRNMLEMYKLVERARRELQEAQSNRLRDREITQGYIEQGNLLHIAPSLLALKDSPIGQALIEQDAELRKFMLAAGLLPAVNIQQYSGSQPQQVQGTPPTIGYLQSPQGTAQAQSNRATYQPSGPLTSAPGSYTSPPGASGPLHTASGTLSPSSGYPTVISSSGLLFPIGNQSGPLSPAPSPAPTTTTPGTLPISPTRQEQELAELQTAGFLCAGKGQHTPTFDASGQPIAGSTEWVLETYLPRPQGYFTLIFHCPIGYPLTPPKVQVRLPDGGGLRWEETTTLREWHPGRLLVEVAREIDEKTPG
jgi:hypothetical protein